MGHADEDSVRGVLVDRQAQKYGLKSKRKKAVEL